ncbi:MAG TPA: glucokinase, partial [Rhizomicrobium sp.]|nr:glucokinase [Rhizomicrobium sp.]
MTDFCALVGDIGGTNARLAFAEFSDGVPVISQVKHFASGQYPSGGAIVRDYLAQTARLPDAAALAVAGPVVDGTVQFTNLGWTVSESELHGLGIPAVRLLNDFESLAVATRYFVPADLHRVGPVEKGDAKATMAVIGPG